MTTLDRNPKLSEPVYQYGCVAIEPELPRAAHLERWLYALSPKKCKLHQRTALVLARNASLKHSSDDCLSHEHLQMLSQTNGSKFDIDKFYYFRAEWHCRSCKVAYSLAPPEFHVSTFDGYETSTAEMTENLAKCREFASQVNASGAGFLLLSGLPGTGKTRLACNIVSAVNELDALYLTQGRVTLLTRQTYGKHFIIRPGSDAAFDPPKPIWGILQNVFLLVLDEIGAKALAADELLVFDEVLKYRYDHRKPTILISNLPLGGKPDSLGLKEFLGDALTDRIRHAAGGGKFILQFSGASFRRDTRNDYISGLS